MPGYNMPTPGLGLANGIAKGASRFQDILGQLIAKKQADEEMAAAQTYRSQQLGIDQQRIDLDREQFGASEASRASDASRQQMQDAAWNAERGITTGRSDTQVKLGGSMIGAGGTQGEAWQPPAKRAFEGLALSGPGGIRPSGPSPLAMGQSAPSSLTATPKLRGPGMDMAMQRASQATAGPDVEFGKTFATIDPMQSGEVQRELATRQPPKPAEPDAWTGPDGVAYWVDPATRTASPIEGVGRRPTEGGVGGPTGGGVPGIDDLPTTTQAAVTGAAPALDALDRYRAAAAEYLKRGGVERFLGAAGVSQGAQDRSIGALNSMKQALLLHVKQAADLGALNGPDQQIVLEMIGDPTSLGAVRNPDRVLASIDEARNFLESKISGIEGAYGVTVPRPPGKLSGPPDPRARMGGHGSTSLPDDIEAATAEARRRMGR